MKVGVFTRAHASGQQRPGIAGTAAIHRVGNRPTVSIVDVRDRLAVRDAARLERALLSDRRGFYPELDADVERRFSGASALMNDTETAVFVATVGGSPAGRCMAQIPRRWQQHHGEPRSGFIADVAFAADRPEAGAEVIGAAERWLAARVIDRVYGGVNHWFIQMALRTGRFDAGPVFPIRWDPPEVSRMFERLGYRSVLPAWTYTIDLRGSVWRQAAATARQQPVVVRPINKRRWREDLATVADVVNETFVDEWEFQPLSYAEWHEVFDPFKALYDAHYIQLAEVGGRVAGVCVAGRDLVQTMRRLDGRAGPVRFLRALHDFRHTRCGSVFIVGVRSAARGRGVGAALVAAVLERFAQQGMTSAVYHLVNDENQVSRSLAQRFGGVGEVLHHRFERCISSTG